MTVLTTMKEAAAEYLNAFTAPASDVADVLSAVVSQEGEGVFLDTDRLRAAMLQQGAREEDVLKVCLMTKVTGFPELLEKDSRTQQIDLDRFIRNAVEETGFTRTAVMELTRAIALATEIAFDYKVMRRPGRGRSAETAYTVPASLYQSELESFGKAFNVAAYRDYDVTTLDFSRLEPLVAAGIPKAKFYLGYCLLYGVRLEENSERGLALLQEAADAGDIEAAAVLGDFYYGSGPSEWGQAYSYYTGYGALALNEERQGAITDILNQKKYNRKIILLSAVFLAVLLATVIIAPGASIYLPYRILGIVSLVIGAAALVLTVLAYRVRPYGDYHWAAVVMFAAWSIYIAVRVLF